MPWATRSNPSEEAHVSILDNQNDALRSTVNYKPEVGNGFLATVVGSDALYVAGVFNGFGDLSVQPSQKPSFGVSAGAQRERRGRYEVINHGSLNVADDFAHPLMVMPRPCDSFWIKQSGCGAAFSERRCLSSSDPVRVAWGLILDAPALRQAL